MHYWPGMSTTGFSLLSISHAQLTARNLLLSSIAPETIDDPPDTPRSWVGNFPLLEIFLVDVSTSTSLGD